MKNVYSLMDKNLVKRLNQLDDLTRIIFDALNLSATRHSLWVTQKNHQLDIITNDSILATKVRLGKKEIIQYINTNSSLIIKEINIKLAHLDQVPSPKQNRTIPISRTAAQNLEVIANTIDDDGLKQSLLDIANVARKNKLKTLKPFDS